MPFLDWVNKAQAVSVAGAVPYHLLNFVSSHGDPVTDNLLIQGDNLLALKALLPFHRGQVKCVFIDPPYNTQSAFEQYDDKLEHSQWLSMMHPRLVLLRELLSESGSIWVTIDDNEAHYLKVLMDEVFGRANFVTSICWEKVYTLKNTARHFSEQHDHILVYAKSLPTFSMNHLPRGEKQNSQFKNPDNDSRGPWLDSAVHARNFYSKGSYEVVGPSGKAFSPPQGRFWTVSEENFRALDRDGRIWWGKTGANAPRKKAFLSEVKSTVVPGTIWSYEDAGQNAEAKSEIKELFSGVAEVFITPKPEKLLQRILTISTNPGDLVLDSYLGSGTTAAVAHKMGRRYVGIELGEQASSHCLPRLISVVAGDQGGISNAVSWRGGGGFRFYSLGDPVFHSDGSINPAVQFNALAGYLWHFETGQPATQIFESPLLGVHGEIAVFLLYNGILGDRRSAGGNVLTASLLNQLDQLLAEAQAAGASLTARKVVYGEATRLSEQRLAESGVTFRQIPYDIKVR